MIELQQTWHSRCGLEYQFKVVKDGVIVGHVLAAIGRQRAGWQVLTSARINGTSGVTLTGKAKSRRDAVRMRRQHLAEIPTRI